MQTRWLIVYEDEGVIYDFFIRAATAQEALDEFIKFYGGGGVFIIDVRRAC